MADLPAHAAARTAEEEGYFREIEAAFCRLRGRHLFLSHLDVALVDSWWHAGVPLAVVLRAITSVFERRRAAGSGRSVLTLAYCRHAVEEEFEDWKESRLGARRAGEEGSDAPVPSEAAAFLAARAADLERAAAALPAAQAAIVRAGAARVVALADALLTPQPPSLAEAEERLEEADDALLDDLAASLLEAESEALLGAARLEIEPLRGRLTARAYEATLQSRLRGEVRRRFALPRLSLYLL